MRGLDRNTEGKITIKDRKVLRRKLIAEAAIYIYIYSISNGSVIVKEFTSIRQQDEERS